MAGVASAVCKEPRAVLEVELLEREVSLHDAGGLHARSQHVLLGGDVVCLGYPFQVVQVTERTRFT